MIYRGITLILTLLFGIHCVGLESNMEWKTLKEGNQRFVAGKSMHHDNLATLSELHDHQHPGAITLSCSDSRVPPDIVFDQGLGDVFVVRNAGNVVSNQVLASIEYAAAVLHVPLLVVMGHTRCGAMAAACHHVKMGHVTELVVGLQPAVNKAIKSTGISDCDNPVLVDAIAKENVRMQIASVKAKSKIVNDLYEKGTLHIMGALFDLKTGRVEAIDE